MKEVLFFGKLSYAKMEDEMVKYKLIDFKNHVVRIFWLSFLHLILYSLAYAQNDINEGIKLFEGNELSAARTFFESYIKLNIENASAFFYLGRIYFKQNDNDKALKSLEQAIQINDRESDYHLWLGHTYGRKAQNAGLFNRLKLAKYSKAAYERAVEIDPSNAQARDGLMEYLLQAPGIAGGSVDKAIEQAEEIKKLDRLRGHMAFVSIYGHEKKYDLQEEELLAVIEKDPESIGLKYQLGYNYVNQEKYEEAFTHFEKMMAVNPQDMNAYYQIGRTAAISGQNLDRGIECLQFYLNHDPTEGTPSHAAAHWRLGIVYEHKQDIDAAVEEYETALKLEPEYKSAKDALKRLKKK